MIGTRKKKLIKRGNIINKGGNWPKRCLYALLAIKNNDSFTDLLQHV